MFEKQPWMQRAGEYPMTDQDYFTLLSRAVFSAGLGPKVVESRWEGIKGAFRDFEPAAVRAMDEQDVGELLADPAVIRNRRKIEAVIKNAAAFEDLLAEHKSFHTYLGSLGAATDLPAVADALSQVFTHLGKTSAMYFLFSAGWRTREPVEVV